jgi:predicted nucleic acid-binding protein
VKYAFDTNVFIDGFRSEAAEAELLAFLKAAIPFTFLSAVVVQELVAGARTAAAHRALQRGVVEPFMQRGRVFAPSAEAFVVSGRAVAALAGRQGWGPLHPNPSLLNDALLAASCREQGVTLITRDADFKRLAPFVSGFRYAAPWPAVVRRPH